MPFFTDQTGRIISLPETPKRIVSLVPSQTELLFDLGLTHEVVGITKFCIHPAEWFRTKTRVGGTKQIKTALIQQLQPDLIIANKEENVKEQVEELSEGANGEKQIPVWVSDVNNLPDAYEMIEQLGSITGKEKKAGEIVSHIKENFSRLPSIDSGLRTAYLIWQDPYMTIAGDTFIHSMLQAAGLINIYATKTRYPEITIAELQAANCQLLLLSSEPYPFKQKHIEELQARLPATMILLADGEMFSWYGSRLLQAPGYFEKLFKQMIDDR
ncbi:MAG: ABC transporter substrate-binding protein [Chitinophagaceae bacterium]|nr:ABC transporter substrate-binding protein [Chitinophagaceae bacterium]